MRCDVIPNIISGHLEDAVLIIYEVLKILLLLLQLMKRSASALALDH